MSGTIITEWHFWMASIITGVIMTFAYDILRLLRRIIRHNRFFVDMEDLLFWAACFFTSFTLLYYGNNGVIRFAAVMGAGIGMLAYTLTVGRFFGKVQRFRYSQGDRYRALDDRQDKGIFALALYTSTTSLQSASMRSGKNFQKYKIQVDAKDNSS